MPKSSKITGVDRFNLMLAIVGYLIHAKEPVPIPEIAKRFKISELEVRDAAKTISLSGMKPYGPGDLFDVDYDDGEVFLRFNPGIDDVPKLSARQSAALVASLLVLKKLEGFTQDTEVEELIDLLKQGSVTNGAAPISIAPGTIDADAFVLRQAIASDTRISCEYRNAQGEQRFRTIDPLRLESLDNVWYLRGYCPDREKVLAFRLDRMRSTTILNEPISDVAKNSVIPDAIYQPNDSDTVVTIQVAPEAFALISEFASDNDPVQQDDGSMIFKVKIGDIHILGKIISRYAGAAKVLEPQAAREIVRDYALRALGTSTSASVQSAIEEA